jgi:nucleoside phosphorylase
MMQDQVKKKISIGLLSAIVKPEFTSANVVLERQGWVKTNPQPKALTAAAISEWSKDVAGVQVILRSGVIGDMGQTSAAIETYAFLERAESSIVILCGIAGSLKKNDFKKGDVIVAKKVSWAIQDRMADSRDTESPCHKYRWKNKGGKSYEADFSKRLELNVLNFLKGQMGSRAVHCEEIFSWEYVADGESVTKYILANAANAACVEMEAGGFLGALARYSTIRGGRPMEGFVVRGISDYTDEKDKVTNDRTLAAENAAIVALGLVEQLVDINKLNILETMTAF